MTTKRAVFGLLTALVMSGGCGEDAKTADTTEADTTSDVAPDAEDVAEDVAADTTTGPTAEQQAILGVPETARFTLTGLSAPVQVVRTEAAIPHLYGENPDDVARVVGFVQARDRFFFMDLQRRLGLGTISELLGSAGLGSDIESRGTGMAYVTDRIVAHLSPEFRAYLTAFADGVNQYIEAVRRDELPGPTETQFSALLGYDSPADMMKPFALRDVVALATVFMYSTNFETGDVGATAAAQRVDGLFAGATNEALRKDGYLADLWNDVRPIFPGTNTTDGVGLTGAGASTASGAGAGAGAGNAASSPADEAGRGARRLPAGMAQRLHDKLQTRFRRLGKDRDAGFGSNMWAVQGTKTKDGASLLANDGHLELSVPPLAWGTGLDTRVFGGGDLHQLGGWLGTFPVIVGGTNGDVAWGGVNPVLDITDWYREELQLDADGAPAASKFDGEWKPLVALDESYEVAAVAALGSVGRTETWTHWTTFDGRWITSIEGRPVTGPDDAGAGETVVNVLGDLVVPKDMDDDGVIEALSFDHTALDATRWPEALFQVGLAKDVSEVREATRGYVGAALFTQASDRHGDIFYTSYQAVPCRGYLGRSDGAFAPGADPTRVIDGTQFGGFEIPTDANGKSDEAPGQTDPQKCVVPFDEMPYAINPTTGFLFSANNDPGGLTDDGDEKNDAWYLGGPWSSVRANTIRKDLVTATAGADADVAAMETIQASKESRLGRELVPHLLAAIQHGKDLGTIGGTPADWEIRLEQRYSGRSAEMDEVAARLDGWATRGFVASSGVETFYASPDADAKANAVSAMIFNAWIRRFLSLVWDDEGINAWRWSGSREQVAAVFKFLAGRGPNNPGGLASWDAETEEAVFFDRLGTTAVERADELMLQALEEALDWLESDTTSPGAGGFGTTDMDQWLWGLRHQVKFRSILAGYIGNDPTLSLITDLFEITTDRLPLADSFTPNDPRAGLKWFPRGGDQWGVDAGNPGLGGTDYTYGSGPAMRIVVALKDGAVEGSLILPGGESALTDSPHFDDQARLWLANEYLPLRFAPADVAAGATGREVYAPPAE